MHDCLQAEQRQRKTAKLKAASCGDTVCSFDEVSAAQGCLGRFPGSSVLSLVKQVAEA